MFSLDMNLPDAVHNAKPTLKIRVLLTRCGTRGNAFALRLVSCQNGTWTIPLRE